MQYASSDFLLGPHFYGSIWPMPMTLLAQFTYFLLIVLLYGSPITLVVLYLGWRRKQLAKAAFGLLTVNLIAAGLAVAGVHLSARQDAVNYQAGLDSIEAYVGDPARLSVVQGRFVGTETHGGYDYRYYQFPALDGSARELEMVVPPDGINAAAYIRHGAQSKPGIDSARLIVWPRHIGMNPSLQPEAFFAEHVEGEVAHSFGQHTLIAALRPRDSVIVYPPQPEAETWLWRRAVLEL